MKENYKNKVLHMFKAICNRGLPHILLGSFITKFIAMFGSIFIVRILTKQEYGELAYIENLYGYIYIFSGIGLNNAISRYCVLGKDIAEQYIYDKYIKKNCIIINCIIVILSLVFMKFYQHPSEFIDIVDLLMIYLLVLPIQAWYEGNALTFRALFDNQRYAIYSTCLAIGVVVFRIIYSYIWHLKGVVIAQISVYFIMAVAGYKILSKNYFSKIIRKNANKIIPIEKKKEMWIYSIQYMITNGIWAIFMLNDIYMLGKFGNDALAVANYKVAYTIPGSIAILSTAIGIFVSPYFVRNENNHSWIRRNFKRVYLINIFCILGITIILFVLSRVLIIVIYGSQYLEITTLMRILLISAFINAGLRYPCANILAAMGQIKYNMLISMCGVILQIVMNLYMIPRYKSIGTAITSCTVYFGMALSLIIIFLNKYYRERKDEVTDVSKDE